MAGWAHTFNQPTFRYNFRGHIKSRTTRNYISKKHKDFFPAPIALYCTVQDFMEILCVFKMNEMILAKYRDLIQTKNFKISNVIINPNQGQPTTCSVQFANHSTFVKNYFCAGCKVLEIFTRSAEKVKEISKSVSYIIC